MKRINLLNGFWCVLLLLFCAVMAQAQTPIKLAPMPFLEQCGQPKSGAEAEQAAQALLAKLRDKDAAVRAQAAEQLGQGCYQTAVSPLITALRDETPQVRAAAITALGRLGDKESVQDLQLMVADENPTVKLALIQSLASFKIFQARNTVLNSIANPSGEEISDETDARLRAVAVLTVNELTDPSFSFKAIGFIFGFLTSRHAVIRQVAEETMRALKDTRNAPVELIATLKLHKNPELRRLAATWLGKLGIERGRAVLTEAAVLDSNGGVKEAAAAALAQLNAAAKSGK